MLRNKYIKMHGQQNIKTWQLLAQYILAPLGNHIFTSYLTVLFTAYVV